jgi:excisionase family DNA binding protein
MNEQIKNTGNNSTTQEWLTSKEVLKRLKISRTTLYEWEQENKLTAYRIGSIKRYKLEDVENILVPEIQDEQVGEQKANEN